MGLTYKSPGRSVTQKLRADQKLSETNVFVFSYILGFTCVFLF